MTTYPAATVGSPAEPRLTGLAARVSRAWGENRAYRTTLAELGKLTDNQLRDLGMRRDALRTIAREAARKI